MADSSYGAGAGLKELLEAMKAKAIADTTYLSYVKPARVIVASGISNGFFPDPIYDEPVIYLEPNGSPETVEGEGGPTVVLRATHKVVVHCVLQVTGEIEDSVLGKGKKLGVVEFVDNVLDFYGGNLLDLSGLAPSVKPTIEAPDNAYDTIRQGDDSDVFLRIASLLYEATTRAYTREA